MTQLKVFSVLCVSIWVAFASPAFVLAETVNESKEISVRTFEIELSTSNIDRAKNVLVIQNSKTGARFEFNNEPPTKEAAAAFSKMSDFDRARFMQFRREFLSAAMSTMVRSEITLGFGSLIKQTLRRFFWRKDKTRPIEELAKASLPDDQETPRTIRQRGQRIVHRILVSADRVLWGKALDVIMNNEFFTHMTVGIPIGGVFVSLGLGGVAALDFQLGYNGTYKQLFYQIEPVNEVFDTGVAVVGGLQVKFGSGMRYSTRGGRGANSEIAKDQGVSRPATYFPITSFTFGLGLGEYRTRRTNITPEPLLRVFVKKRRSTGNEMTVAQLTQYTVDLAQDVKRESASHKERLNCERELSGD